MCEYHSFLYPFGPHSSILKREGKDIPKPAFNAAVDETLNECLAISNQRGGEYKDTWALENQVTTCLDMVFRQFNVTFTPEQKRLILVASLADVKDSRMIGEFKPDTFVDGINYRAAVCKWMKEWIANK